jgi:Capsule assembly protein Wzi/PAP2 superfamily
VIGSQGKNRLSKRPHIPNAIHQLHFIRIFALFATLACLIVSPVRAHAVPVQDGAGAAQTAANQTATAQTPGATPSPTPVAGVTFKHVFTNLPGDQKAIWTSPFHIRATDAFWLVPLAATSGVLIGSDQHSMTRVHSNAQAITRSNHIADGGLVAFAAWPAAMYVWGSVEKKPRPRETGLLTGEALINSIVVNEAFKYAFMRERPQDGTGQGRFFHPSSDPGFPSMHAQLSWSAASVIAHEYPNSYVTWLAYGAATTVSIARITGRQHFPSDVVIGGAVGWLIGRQAFKAHHDPELDKAAYGMFQQGDDAKSVTRGSTYVPLDSWIYPALERLGAMGYVPSQMTGLRPWTRQECKRETEEAEYIAESLPADSPVRADIRRLKEEFSHEGQAYYSAQVDSVYMRYGRISGTPLRNSYHFGQTLWNDFGRPFDEGNNAIAGATASATAGRFFFYTQGEYQHAPGRAALTPGQAAFIAGEDSNPVQTPTAVNAIDRFYPIDMHAGAQVGNYAVSVGKQSEWLGPTEMGALMVSDNADPMYSVRLSRTAPLVLPGFLYLLGPIRGEVMFAKLSGHQFPARPFFNLQKISLHPTQNLEVGFTRSSLWGGVGHPFTLRSLARNFGSFSSPAGGGVTDRNDPGDRKAGFDFSYKLPGLRHWLTLYSDSYSDDDPSPLANPRRAAINPGIYLTHVPGVEKLDLRVEATSTQLLTAFDLGPSFLYFNNQYHDANTNKGVLFGNQTGRDGRGYQGWSTYHFSAATSFVVSYREIKSSNFALPGGGTQSDGSARLRWEPRPQVMVDAFVQYERWLVPVVKPGAQHDVTGQVQVTWKPGWEVHHD